MFEQMIIDLCSPTLAGLKTANLFTCRYACKKSFYKEIRCFNQALSHKGIRMVPLRFNGNSALIYLYRPNKLKSDMNDAMCAKILQAFGYNFKNSNNCIAELIRRFESCSDFPHEIGLFLGYPPEDVKCFIEHEGKRCKCVGCWKVYCDEERAKKCFANYKKCTQIYKEQYAKGRSIERLIVAV